MSFRPLLCTSLLLFATSCGGSEVNANAALDLGFDSLTAEEYDDALMHFETALASLAPGDENYLGAKLNQVKALAFIDPERAKATLLGIPENLGVRPGDYRMIVGELTTSAEALTKKDMEDLANQSMEVAVQILHAGSETFPEFGGWNELVKITGKKAESLGASEALSGLIGLGYAGDGNE